MLYGGWTNLVGELVDVPANAAGLFAWVAPNHLLTPKDDPRCYLISFARVEQLALRVASRWIEPEPIIRAFTGRALAKSGT